MSKNNEPEFWTILKTPPKKPVNIEDEFMILFSKELMGEIDAEILAELIKVNVDSKSD